MNSDTPRVSLITKTKATKKLVAPMMNQATSGNFTIDGHEIDASLAIICCVFGSAQTAKRRIRVQANCRSPPNAASDALGMLGVILKKKLEIIESSGNDRRLISVIASNIRIA